MKPLAFASLLCFALTSRAADDVAAPLIDFGVKGGWCWFQDERAIVDGDKFIFGSVACPSGDIQVTCYNLTSKTATTFVLHAKFQSDDHDTPALMRLTDGRYLAKYAHHGNTRFMRWRISKKPGDITDWEPEQTLDVGAGCSYMNVYRLSAENGKIYNFHRGLGFNPNYLVSEDDGKTFKYGGRLVEWAADKKSPGSGRPYPRYTSNNVDTIHFIMTEDHPRNFDNSIYHGYIKNGKLHKSDGIVLGDLSTTKTSPHKPTDFTQVYKGGPDNVAWTSDIRLDKQGLPCIAFSVQMNSGKFKADFKNGGDDLRYFYGRWDGAKWNVHEMAYAGHRLYTPEVDYSGLVALHPGNPSIVFISTSSDPKSNKPLVSTADNNRHYEIYKGTTADGGQTWTWTPITSNSTADNIRPIARAVDPSKTMVIWQRGTYSTYTKYDVKAVGIIDTGLGK